MSNVIPFNYNSKEVRVIKDESGNPWWVAKDVCDVLDIKNATQAISILDDDERSMQNIGRQGEANIINESGLYALIIRSNKPQSKPFRKWVTSEVLTSIRKTGSYKAPNQKPATLLPIDREFRAAVRMAKAAGLKGNQAVLSANRLTREMTGSAPLQLLEITHLESATKEAHLTPSDIGKQLGLSGRKVNKTLAANGLQTAYRDHKDRLRWKPTPKGAAYSVAKDTGKKHSDGTPVVQLFWLDSVLDSLKMLAAA
ncbi:MAG: BRO family protein [Desulfobacterales bacterium]|nr:BRO family protein [Desulfobacterales bacterium]MDD4070841.1 BRO family protein [Desulfobacterales bacterium]MDD4391243.1 BRO family protein [Desulfobacterales bacterium]